MYGERVIVDLAMGESIVLASLTGAIEDAGRKLRKNPKRTGELSEAAFLLKAQSMGFRVARSWGDSERYDFILDSGGRLWRVQLKCTEVLHGRGYEIQPIYGVYGKGKAAYTEDEIDVLVVHIGPLNVWYVRRFVRPRLILGEVSISVDRSPAAKVGPIFSDLRHA